MRHRLTQFSSSGCALNGHASYRAKERRGVGYGRDNPVRQPISGLRTLIAPIAGLLLRARQREIEMLPRPTCFRPRSSAVGFDNTLRSPNRARFHVDRCIACQNCPKMCGTWSEESRPRVDDAEAHTTIDRSAQTVSARPGFDLTALPTNSQHLLDSRCVASTAGGCRRRCLDTMCYDGEGRSISTVSLMMDAGTPAWTDSQAPLLHPPTSSRS